MSSGSNLHTDNDSELDFQTASISSPSTRPSTASSTISNSGLPPPHLLGTFFRDQTRTSDAANFDASPPFTTGIAATTTASRPQNPFGVIGPPSPKMSRPNKEAQSSGLVTDVILEIGSHLAIIKKHRTLVHIASLSKELNRGLKGTLYFSPHLASARSIQAFEVIVSINPFLASKVYRLSIDFRELALSPPDNGNNIYRLLRNIVIVCKTLDTVAADDTSVNPAGIAPFSRGLPPPGFDSISSIWGIVQARSLKALSIINVGHRDGGRGWDLGRLFYSLPDLEELELGGLDAGTVESFMPSPITNSLRHLRLSVVAGEVRVFQRLIPGTRRLRSFDLEHNVIGMSSVAINSLCEFVSGLVELEALTLDVQQRSNSADPPLTHDTCQTILQSCQKLRLLQISSSLASSDIFSDSTGCNLEALNLTCSRTFSLGSILACLVNKDAYFPKMKKLKVGRGDDPTWSKVIIDVVKDYCRVNGIESELSVTDLNPDVATSEEFGRLKRWKQIPMGGVKLRGYSA